MSDSGILAEEFLLGQKDLQDLEDLDSSDASYNDKVDSCKKHFNRAAILVNRLSVFSSNEDIDEINTTDLRYLLIPYYLALVEQKISDMKNRYNRLKTAQLCFKNFFKLCEQLGLLREEDKEEMRNVEENESRLSPKEKRDLLISRANYERDIKEKQKALVTRKLRLVQQKGPEAEQLDSEYDEIERELTKARLALAINATFREIRMIEQELPMLERMNSLQAQGPQAVAEERQKFDQEVAKLKKGSGKQPITIVKDDRGELRAQVFRPHWIQPTMSIEEAAEIDMQYAIRGGGAASAKKKEKEDDSDPDDDEEWRKKREWDDWKDDHPTGSGNKMGNLG